MSAHTSLPIAAIDPHRHSRPPDIERSLLAALADPATYGCEGPVETHETHASWVFVVGARAYKVKKPVTLAFLDYGTLAQRHAACREEVRVNRELAPGIYLGVRAIVRADGRFGLVGEQAASAVEYAVVMRAFDEADSLAGLIAEDRLTPEHVRSVARRLAAFHRTAPAVQGGGVREVGEMWARNVRELMDAQPPSDWHVDVAEGFGAAFLRAHEREVGQRERDGLVRDGHGDLRCEHVLAVPVVRVVDRVEFDPALRRTDVACDLAFLAMDLEAHGCRWAAVELVEAYRRDGMSPGSDALQAFYAAYRAIVRAKVALIAAAERGADAEARALGAGESRSTPAQAQRLWNLAETLCWRARRPLALVVCGPAASGKSTLAGELARRSGMALLSSDLVRKAAAGVAPSERAAPEHYSGLFTHATYELLGREAQQALARERGVIVDATCRSHADRELLLSGLQRAGLTWLAVRCRAPLEVASERAARRLGQTGHVSDATPQIVAEHYRTFEELTELPSEGVLELDTERPLDVQVAEVARAVDGRL